MTTPIPTPDTNPLARFWAAEDAPSPQARKAFRVCHFLSIIALISIPQYTYSAFQTGVWQLFVLIAIQSMITVGALIGAMLCRRGRIETGIGVTIGAVLVSVLVASAILAGVGFPIALLTFVACSAIAFQTLPARAATPAILIIIPASIVMALLDFAHLSFQYPIPNILPIIQVIGGIATVIFIFNAVFRLAPRASSPHGK